MARSQYFTVAAVLIVGLALGACAKLGFGALPVAAPVAQPAAQPAQAPAKVSTVIVQVPATPAPAPTASLALPYPTLPAPAAAPNVTVNPAPVNVQPANVVVEGSKSLTAIHIPWGDYTLDLLNILWAAFGVYGVALIKRYLAQAPVLVQAGVAMAGGADAVIQQIHDLAVNSIEGAAKGKALDVNVGSKVFATALQLAVDKGPGFISDMGGLDAVKQKLFAALHLDESASAAQFGVSVPGANPPIPANDTAAPATQAA